MTMATNNGNGQTYTWDAENELTTITYASGASTQFTYDTFGRRTAIVEWPGAVGSGTPTSTKQFVWVGMAMAEERDASNTVTKRFFDQGEQMGGSSYYYTRDHLGSVREMTDASGTLVSRLDYDPWGQVTVVSGTTLPDMQYAGDYEHAPSGLNLTLFRAYDPSTSKWLSRDPLGESQGPNLYAYCGNDGVNAVDPLGLDPTYYAYPNTPITGYSGTPGPSGWYDYGDLITFGGSGVGHFLVSTAGPGGITDTNDNVSAAPTQGGPNRLIEVEERNFQPHNQIPHTFLVIGNKGYGFYPARQGWPEWPGQVSSNDFNHPWTTGTLYMCTPAQVAALLASIAANQNDWYDLSNTFGNNCTGWADSQLANAGITNGFSTFFSGVIENPWTH
jgi:RHS repeat-associated protein